MRSRGHRPILTLLLIGVLSSLVSLVWCYPSSSFVVRTLFHLLPHDHSRPLHSLTAAAATTGGVTRNNQHQLAHTPNARASTSIATLGWTTQFKEDDDDAPLLFWPIDTATKGRIELAPHCFTHPSLNRLIQLECGVVRFEYCTDSFDDDDGVGVLDWSHMQRDQPCILPIVQIEDRNSSYSTDSSTNVEHEFASSLARVSGVSMILLLPVSDQSHPSPTHPHGVGGGQVNHANLPDPHDERFWKEQCRMTIGNEFERETPDEVHPAWVERDGSETEEIRTLSHFSRESSSSADSSLPSLWHSSSSSFLSSFLSTTFREFQVRQSRRSIPVDDEDQHEYDEFLAQKRTNDGDNTHGNRNVDNDTLSSSSSPDVDGAFSFLETGSVLDILDASSVLAEVHSRDMVDTNNMYRLLGQLTAATRTGASATVCWELIIRPIMNILRRVLLSGLKELAAKLLVKSLHSLVTSTINPHDAPPDESEYTKPPVWEVESPEQLWASEPAEVPEAIVPEPEHGTDLGATEIDSTIFLSVEHVLGTRGILDPLLAFLVPVLHNTITQSTHDIAQKGISKSIQMHSIGPMKETIHAGVHRKSVEMLTSQLVTQLTEHVTKHLIAQLPRTLTILCTQDIHKALSRPLTFQLTYGLTFALTRSTQQDEECQQCESDSTKCSACDVTKANDYYVNYYVDWYGRYFEKFYTFYYTEHYAKLFANDQLRKG